MSRVLFAWELGANYGHLSRDLPVAERLHQAGHEVRFVVRDARVAAELLRPKGFRFLPLPRPNQTARLSHPPANYAELLLAEGYGDTLQLTGLLEEWLGILDLYRPALLFADHAPTALLAARFSNIPSIVCGTGFEIPPNGMPWPSIRPWEEISDARLLRSEEWVLKSINKAAQNLRRPGLQKLPDLFANAIRVLVGFPELDHYGAREGEDYAGAFYRLPTGLEMEWPASGNRKRILAYLRPQNADFINMLAALRDSDAAVLCAAPGLTVKQAEQFSSAHMRVSVGALNIGPLLANADAVVGYGSTGLMMESLLASVPVLSIPQNVEQQLGSLRLERIGAGILVGKERTRAGLGKALSDILEQRNYRDAAGAFADKYRGYSSSAALDRLVTKTLAAMGQPVLAS